MSMSLLVFGYLSLNVLGLDEMSINLLEVTASQRG